MGGLKELGKSQDHLDAIINDANTNISAEEQQLAGMALGGNQRGHVLQILKQVRDYIDQGLAEPHGGELGIANAMGREALFASASRQGGLYGAACGEILSYIVSMNVHHPELKPSINKATEILKAQAKRDGREIPPERDHTTMWTEWWGTAPLWAAELMLTQKFGPNYIKIDDFGPRHLIIAGANTLTQWCLRFKPKGSAKTLLAQDKSIHFAKALPAPALTARKLTDEQVKWAQSYRVRP